MDKILLKQLRKLNVKEQEITIKEKSIIKEYVDDKQYSLEKLELIKIEMNLNKERKLSVVFPVILSIFATLILEIAKKLYDMAYDFLYSEIQIEETYELVKEGMRIMNIATDEQKKVLTIGIVQIVVGFIFLIFGFLLAVVAYILTVQVILSLLGGALRQKDKVYQYYYEEYIDEKISYLKKQREESPCEDEKSSSLEEQQTVDAISASYDVSVCEQGCESWYKICVSKRGEIPPDR